jgi:alpha/beta superfamily hydrolase
VLDNAADQLGDAKNLTEMYILKDDLIRTKQPLQIEYSPTAASTKTLDLALLPDALPAKDDTQGWAAIKTVIKQFDEYKLTGLRQNYLVLGEAQGSNWERAGEFVRKEMFNRWSDAIAQADARVSGSSFTSFTKANVLNEDRRAVARVELRRRIHQSAMHVMSGMQNPEMTPEGLQEMDGNIRRWLRTVDARKLYEEVDITNMTSNGFSPLKFAINQIERSSAGIMGIDAEKMLMSARSAEEKRLGVTLNHAVDSLIAI